MLRACHPPRAATHPDRRDLSPDPDVEPGSAYAAFLAELYRDREFTHVEVSGFSAPEVAELLEGRTDSPTTSHASRISFISNRRQPLLRTRVMRSHVAGEDAFASSTVGVREVVEPPPRTTLTGLQSRARTRKRHRTGVRRPPADRRRREGERHARTCSTPSTRRSRRRLLIQSADLRGHTGLPTIVRDAIRATMTRGRRGGVASRCSRIARADRQRPSSRALAPLLGGGHPWARRAGDDVRGPSRPTRHAGTRLRGGRRPLRAQVAAHRRVETLAPAEACDLLLELAGAYNNAGDTAACETMIEEVGAQRAIERPAIARRPGRGFASRERSSPAARCGSGNSCSSKTRTHCRNRRHAAHARSSQCSPMSWPRCVRALRSRS